MSDLPQTNATLVLIAADAGSENYTRKAATPETKWSGTVDAYVRRKIVSNLNQSGELNRVQSTEIIIPGDLVPHVDVEAGDTLEYEEWDEVLGEMRKYRARVQTFSTPANLPSLPSRMKIALEKVAAAP